MSAPVLTGLFDWDSMSSELLGNWSQCTLPIPDDCDTRQTCDNMANVTFNETDRRRLLNEWDWDFYQSLDPSDESYAQMRRLLDVDSECCDVPAPTSCDEESIAVCHNVSGNSYDVGRVVLCKPSLISLSCGGGLLFSWPYLDLLPKGYYEVEDELYPYYYNLSTQERGDGIYIGNDDKLQLNSTFEEYQEWITQASESGNYTCQEMLYPFTRACCPGYYCPAARPCMYECTVKGGYCPSSDTQSADNDCPDLPVDNGYQDALGCGGSATEFGACPAGDYCETPAEREKCPSGSYCNSGSYKPIRCQFFQICTKGSSFPDASIIMAMAIVIFFSICAMLLLRKRIIAAILPVVHWILQLQNVREWLGTEKLDFIKDYFRDFQESMGYMLGGEEDERAIPLTSEKHSSSTLTRGFTRKKLTQPSTRNLNPDGTPRKPPPKRSLAKTLNKANTMYDLGLDAYQHYRAQTGQVAAPALALMHRGDAGAKSVTFGSQTREARLVSPEVESVDQSNPLKPAQLTTESEPMEENTSAQTGESAANGTGQDSPAMGTLKPAAGHMVAQSAPVDTAAVQKGGASSLMDRIQKPGIEAELVLSSSPIVDEEEEDEDDGDGRQDTLNLVGGTQENLKGGVQAGSSVEMTSLKQENNSQDQIVGRFESEIPSTGLAGMSGYAIDKLAKESLAKELHKQVRKKNYEGEEMTKEEAEIHELKRTLFHMDIGFDDLSLKIKGSGLQVVEPCSGDVPCGSVTAVMGPSGAGKTSFLFALNGKAKAYAKIGGSMRINGDTFDGMDSFKDLVGFVPQHDIMSPYLTVRETLKYHARFRLPSSMSEEEKMDIVDETLELLQLDHVANVVIGDEHERGISGGQKKRVNIGMELVSQPMTLFLDEPTSGLDATTSNDVMRVLRTIADERGCNVLVVLHQPRFEIFMQFDNLILLGVGGKMVYMGPTVHVIPYICDQLDTTVPDNTNPADFLMDVIAEQGDELNRLWLETGQNDPLFKFPEQVDPEDRVVTEYTPRVRPNFLVQAILVLKRRMLISYSRQVKAFIADCMVTSVAGFIVGAIAEPADYDGVIANSFMVNLVTSILAVNSSMNDYGSERLIYYREASVGLNRVSYWLGQNLSSLISSIVLPWCFLCFYYTEFQPRGFLIDYWCCQTVFWFSIQSLSQVISVALDSSKSMVVGGALTVILSLTCGFNPRLKELNSTLGGEMYTSCNPARWALEAQWLAETKGWTPVYDEFRDTVAEEVGWKVGNFGLDVAAMISISCVLRLATLLCLYTVNSSKQL